MQLNPRERRIATATAAVAAVAIAYFAFVGPLLARKDDLAGKLDAAQAELDDAQSLLARRATDARRWAAIGPALRITESDAETQLRESVANWARLAGLDLKSNKLDAPVRDKEFSRRTLHAEAAGTMSQLGYFMFCAQSSAIPIRVNSLHVNPRSTKDNALADDFTVSFVVTTTYMNDITPAKPAATAATNEVTR